MTGSARIIRADARALPLTDESVDLVVTSPPYWSLRAYQDNGEAYDGQIGSEDTAEEFIANLIDVTRECVRVLKPTGSIFVNLGDKYGPDKSLLMLPEQYRLAARRELGLIARAVIVWSKCLSGGARVYARTSTGDRPLMLRDLYRAYRPEDVQLWNGQRWTQVVGWERTARDQPLEIEFRTGERVGCTRDHRWPTRRGVVRADELTVGDVVESTRLPQPDAPRTPALLPDEDIGWLVGLYVAEGSRSETTVQFAGHVREDLRHARLARIAEALDGTSAVYQTSDNGATCNLHGSVIAGVIDRYVSTGTARTKRLRHAAWQRSDAFLAAVVEGYLSGDGHYDAKNDRWRVGFTENDEWAADLRTLAARLGAVVRLRRYPHQGFGKTFPGWRGEWRWTRSAHGNARPDGEIVAIRASRARDFYDVEVADDPHLFALASGLLTHNSNGLPESVTDRVRRSHEDWVHLTKMPRYYSAVDEIRVPAVRTDERKPAAAYIAGVMAGKQSGHTGLGERANHLLGSLPGSVWQIPTQPLKVPAHLGIDHFAAFPMEWPRRIIRGWSPAGVCTGCGEGRRPVSERSAAYDALRQNAGDWNAPLYEPGKGYDGSGNRRPTSLRPSAEISITGYACACPDTTASTTPGIVLDPFGGTGTTALVAKAEGRHGISVDMSADYCRLADWRTNDPGELARAMQVDKPPQQLDGQLGMFEEGDDAA